MSNFLAGIRLALGGACVWIVLQVARQAARQATRQWHDRAARVSRLAHPGPVWAAMCRAFAAATRIAVRRHGAHAADVLLCDLDGAVRELTALDRKDVPQ